jgi:rod shape-determining protein MreC
MLRLIARYKTTVVGFLALVLPLVLLWYHGKFREEPTIYERTVVRFVSPAQQVMGGVIGSVATVWTDYIWLVGVQREAAELRETNEHLIGALQRREELERENARLKLLLKFKGERPDLVTVAARVVAKDVSPFHRILKIVISVGADHGVRRYAPVVTQRGVVGHIDKVVGRYAEVKLAVDSGSRLSVNVENTEIKGIAAGSGDKNTYLASFETSADGGDIPVGAWLVTNGEDQRYPRGLRVGKITEVPPQNEEVGLRYQVAPAVNPSRLEQVLVVTSQVERIPSMENDP